MMAAGALDHALEVVARPLRGLSGLARIIGGTAAAVGVLAVAAWLARVGWLNAPEWVLVVWALTLLVLGASAVAARRAIHGLGPWHIGRAMERSGGWRDGALTTVLDTPARGTSDELYGAAVRMRAAEVLSCGPGILAPALWRQRHLSRRAAGALLLGLIGLVAARPATGTPATLWHPIGAWQALVAPVRLSARHGIVARGERAVLDVAAIGHRTAMLYTRAPGEAWHATPLSLDNDGNASFTTPPLITDLLARVEADGRKSPEVRVNVRLAAFLGAFAATVHYPAYLGLDDESLPITGDTLILPEGTRLSFTGRATTPLATVHLVGPGGEDGFAITGSDFRGELTPRASGTWRLSVATAGGGALEGELPLLPVRLVIDSAPVVEVPVPGADTVAAVSMSLAVVVSVRDDHGITQVALESRRRPGGAVMRTPLLLPPGTVDRALITTAIDLAALGLAPGDTLRYVATAEDNAPARHVGRSREFVVRIPTAAERRAAQASETSQTAVAFDSLSRQTAEVQRTEQDLARGLPRSDPQSGVAKAGANAPRPPLSSEAARTAAAAAQAQQKILDDAAKVRQAVQDLREAAERQGVADSALARELTEINQLLDKALSPELRDKLAGLQQALKDLDAERTQAALQDLAKQQAQLKEAMDQARDLFKRAALETSLANLAQDAKDLAGEQHALTGQLARDDSGKAGHAETALSARTDSLAAGLDQAAQQSPSEHTGAGLQQAAQQARAAAATMRQAAQSSGSGKSSDAQLQGKAAEDELNPLSKKINDDRQSMQAEMRAEVKQALDRALAETARLAQRQLAVAQVFQQGALLPDTRIEQGLVEEGAAKVMQQVAAVAAMNALVSPQTGIALAEARRLMRAAVDAVASVNPNVRDAAQQSGDAVDALAIAAFSLMQSKDRVNGSQSGSGVQEALEQMKRMAGRQGQLAQQGAGMMQQGGMDLQQLMQLALQQRALAQQLERMRADGQLPGAGDLSREAKDVAKTMEGGHLDQEVVDRQQKLFQRMLDAGRTLQGDEDDENKQRVATTAKDAPPAVPPPLDPRIRSGAGEIRLPTWESLQRLSPEERRRVVDYFQRLTQGPKP